MHFYAAWYPGLSEREHGHGRYPCWETRATRHGCGQSRLSNGTSDSLQRQHFTRRNDARAVLSNRHLAAAALSCNIPVVSGPTTQRRIVSRELVCEPTDREANARGLDCAASWINEGQYDKSPTARAVGPYASRLMACPRPAALPLALSQHAEPTSRSGRPSGGMRQKLGGRQSLG